METPVEFRCSVSPTFADNNLHSLGYKGTLSIPGKGTWHTAVYSTQGVAQQELDNLLMTHGHRN